jgi:hypothetical protein
MSTFDDGTPGYPGDTVPQRAGNFARDLFERFAATGVEAALAYATYEIANLDPVWVPILTAGLALVKGGLAKMVGRKDSASLDPAV